MSKEQLVWLIGVVSAAPANDLAQVRHKANILLQLADELEALVKGEE